MYAVFTNGGKQYKVKKDQVLKLEKIELEPGAAVEFNEVLLLSNGEDVQLGSPTVAKCKVTAVVVEHGRAKKIKILKFKRRKHQMKRMGHRQWFTKVKITGVEHGS